MPIVKHILTANAGELSPWMDARTDLEKYGSGCRVLENFLCRPQGGISKRPAFGYRGTVHTGATNAVLCEFEIQGSDSILVVIGGGKAKFFSGGSAIQYSGADLTLTIPWADATLHLLRWKQINDKMFFVHPSYAPQQLSRASDTSWAIAEFVTAAKSPFLDDNLDETKKITVSFDDAEAAWSGAAVSYVAGNRVKEGGKVWVCQVPNTSSTTKYIGPTQADETMTGGSTPSAGNVAKAYWDAGYDVLIWVEWKNRLCTVGQSVNLSANFPLWPAFAGGVPSYIGSYWRIGIERGEWEYETILNDSATYVGSRTGYSDVLDCRDTWSFITFGNWVGRYYVEASEDRGTTWETIRAFESLASSLRNVSAEGSVTRQTWLRIAFNNYATGGDGPAYAQLSVNKAYLTGIVKITASASSSTAVAECITPLMAGTSDMWAQGAWGAVQGYPRCIELHQNRLILASTTSSTHTIWGSAVDDYTNFERGTDADQSWAHTVVIGQREPIVWLASDRGLVIGSGIGEYVLRGETDDKAITPEFGVATRHSSFGSHAGGTGAIQADSSTLFVETGGRVLRELNYRYDSDRYEAGNLNLLADHLFDGEIIDSAIQRRPWQVLWFVAGGKLYSLTYERSQNVAAWQRHPIGATVMGVACLRKEGEDEVWCVLNHGSGLPLTVERMRGGALLNPSDDGRWSDSYMSITYPFVLTGNHLAGKTVVGWKDGVQIGPATLNSAFFTGITSGTVIIGLPYTAAFMPMTPEIGLQNGSTRSRECRIHSIVPNLYKACGGKMGESPTGTKFDRLKTGSTFYTGELEQNFDGKHGKTGDVCIISDEPRPFSLRSLALKLNYFGDAS